MVKKTTTFESIQNPQILIQSNHPHTTRAFKMGHVIIFVMNVDILKTRCNLSLIASYSYLTCGYLA